PESFPDKPASFGRPASFAGGPAVFPVGPGQPEPQPFSWMYTDCPLAMSAVLPLFAATERPRLDDDKPYRPFSVAVQTPSFWDTVTDPSPPRTVSHLAYVPPAKATDPESVSSQRAGP